MGNKKNKHTNDNKTTNQKTSDPATQETDSNMRKPVRGVPNI